MSKDDGNDKKPTQLPEDTPKDASRQDGSRTVPVDEPEVDDVYRQLVEMMSPRANIVKVLDAELVIEVPTTNCAGYPLDEENVVGFAARELQIALGRVRRYDALEVVGCDADEPRKIVVLTARCSRARFEERLRDVGNLVFWLLTIARNEGIVVALNGEGLELGWPFAPAA